MTLNSSINTEISLIEIWKCIYMNNYGQMVLTTKSYFITEVTHLYGSQLRCNRKSDICFLPKTFACRLHNVSVMLIKRDTQMAI